MLELTRITAPEWLRGHGVAVHDATIHELGGGVSNTVILVEAPRWRAVLKQSLARLRVEEEWLSDPARVFREAAAMRWLRGKVRGGAVPDLLIEDQPNFAIAMEAAPPGARMWKELLFAGEFEAGHAQAAGCLLGSMIASSFENPDARHIFGDQTVFDQLRLDPYYRFTARRHPRCAEYIENLMRRSAARAASLTHGDWSPKNLLVSGAGMWAIDWEVVHYGDPSFDAAFLLNHLLLKSIAMPHHSAALLLLSREFLRALQAELPDSAGWVGEAAFEHLPALLLARVDGKSPAEYLDTPMKDRAREKAFSLMQSPARDPEEIFAR